MRLGDPQPARKIASGQAVEPRTGARGSADAELADTAALRAGLRARVGRRGVGRPAPLPRRRHGRSAACAAARPRPSCARRARAASAAAPRAWRRARRDACAAGARRAAALGRCGLRPRVGVARRACRGRGVGASRRLRRRRRRRRRRPSSGRCGGGLRRPDPPSSTVLASTTRPIPTAAYSATSRTGCTRAARRRGAAWPARRRQARRRRGAPRATDRRVPLVVLVERDRAPELGLGRRGGGAAATSVADAVANARAASGSPRAARRRCATSHEAAVPASSPGQPAGAGRHRRHCRSRAPRGRRLVLAFPAEAVVVVLDPLVLLLGRARQRSTLGSSRASGSARRAPRARRRGAKRSSRHCSHASRAAGGAASSRPPSPGRPPTRQIASARRRQKRDGGARRAAAAAATGVEARFFGADGATAGGTPSGAGRAGPRATRPRRWRQAELRLPFRLPT